MHYDKRSQRVQPRGPRPRSRGSALMALGLFLGLVLLGATTAVAAGSGQPPVPLGTAGPFAVLAGQTITNTGPSTISGDLGVDPGTAIVGFPPGVQVTGTQYRADGVASGAQSALTTAYNNAAGRTPSTPVLANTLANQVLAPGVYSSTSGLAVGGTVTLNGGGNPGAVFIFQAGTTLITASNTTIALTGGAQACNVFWQVGSSATLGTGTTFVGSVLALTSITAETGSTVSGRLLARNGSVSLDDSTVTVPACAASITTVPSAHSLTAGATLTDAATVTGNAADGTATGSVTFNVCGPDSVTCAPGSGTRLGSPVPLTNGVATSPAFKPAQAGTYCFAATYEPSAYVYQTTSSTGTGANGECVTVTAVSSPTSPSSPPAPGSSGSHPSASGTSVVVPGAHTGQPWAGYLYWLLVAVAGLGGLGLVFVRRYPHRLGTRTPR